MASAKGDRLQPAPVIGWGGNSGFQAVNLAAHFGTKRIILVGFDMRVDLGVHWHGDHRAGLNNPTPSSVERWRWILDRAAPDLAERGIEVVNASPVSALTAYPKIDLRQALEH